jgi:hypothetical protein
MWLLVLKVSLINAQSAPRNTSKRSAPWDISAEVTFDVKLGGWVGKYFTCVCLSLLASPLLELTVRALQSELVDFTDVIILFLAKCFVYFMFMVLDQGKQYVGNTGTMICANW